MHVQYLSSDPVTSGVSREFRWAGATLSVSETAAASGLPAGIDGVLYDYTTRGTDGLADIRGFRVERPGVPIVAVVDTIGGVDDVPVALEPYVDGWIEKDAAYREPRRALAALRYASAGLGGDGGPSLPAIRPETDGYGGDATGEGLLTAVGEPAALGGSQSYDRHRVLRARDRRLADLADGLSHDLRNPLMVAKEYVDLARETGDETYLDRATDAFDRASDLVEGLLTLADTGQGLTVLVDVPIATVATDARDSLEAERSTVSVDANRIVRGDPRLLRRLFEATFGDAIERGGPDVAVHVGTHDGGLYIEDDGPGIEPERREALRSGSDEIGFTVIRDVAAAHGWTPSLGETTTGGNRLELAL